MKDFGRIYYYFIFGACGGLTGWFGAALLLREAGAGPSMATQAAYGALLGAAIGIAIAAYEGVVSRSLIRFVKFGGFGLMLGALAGVLALPLAQWIYGTLIAPNAAGARRAVTWQAVAVGTMCWLIFGGLIGFGESLSKGTQSVKGLLGGILGGLLGGSVYEGARASGVTNTASYDQQLVLAITLGLLGGAIGASIAFVTTALKRAWIEVLDGKFEGRVYDVTKYVDRTLGSRKAGIIGSDEWGANVYLPSNCGVLPQHAEISFRDGSPTFTVLPAAERISTTLVNGRRVSSWPLRDGDRLQIGTTNLVYRNKRK